MPAAAAVECPPRWAAKNRYGNIAPNDAFRVRLRAGPYTVPQSASLAPSPLAASASTSSAGSAGSNAGSGSGSGAGEGMTDGPAQSHPQSHQQPPAAVGFGGGLGGLGARAGAAGGGRDLNRRSVSFTGAAAAAAALGVGRAQVQAQGQGHGLSQGDSSHALNSGGGGLDPFSSPIVPRSISMMADTPDAGGSGGIANINANSSFSIATAASTPAQQQQQQQQQQGGGGGAGRRGGGGLTVSVSPPVPGAHGYAHGHFGPAAAHGAVSGAGTGANAGGDDYINASHVPPLLARAPQRYIAAQVRVYMSIYRFTQITHC